MKYIKLFCIITLISLIKCSSTTSKKSDINYTLIIFPDFCLPKIFYFDMECIKLTMSKTLSMGIMVGSLAFKVPQILKIINAKSSKGISAQAYILDSLAVSSNIIYFFYNGIPFKSYGENVSILIQNMISKFFYKIPDLLTYSSRLDVEIWSNEVLIFDPMFHWIWSVFGSHNAWNSTFYCL